MFGKNKGSRPQSRIDSLVGAGTRVDGDLVFTGGLRVDGYVRGNIVAEPGQPGTLVLSEQGRIEGEVRVPHMVINGAVSGPLHSAEYVELQPKANVSGDVFYNTLEMQLGAVIDGRLVHQDASQADKVVQLKPATGESG